MQKTNSNSNAQSVLISLPPDGGYAWVIVFASFMVNFVIDGIIYSFGKTMAVLAAEMNTPMTQMSVVGSFQQSLFYLMGPITSAFVNRFGFRIVVFTGALVMCVGILAASFVSSYLELLLCYGLLAGIGFGIMFPPSIIIIAYNFEKYRAISTGLGLAGSSFGALCLAPLFSFITVNYGWRVTLRVQSACSIICMLASLAYRPLKPVKVMVTEIESTDEFIQLYDSSGVPAVKSTKHLMAQASDNQPSNYPLKLFKDIDVKRIKESTQLIGKEIKSTGPLDRKDIFYSASLALLPSEYTNKRAVESTDAAPINYHLSMIHEPRLMGSDGATGWYHVSHMIKTALRLLFDVTILKSPAFLTFAMSNFFYVLALYVPYMFVKKRANLQNIPEKYSDWFIPTISIGNFIGRLSSGVIGSMLSTIHPCYLIGFSSMIAGAITIVSAFVLEDNEHFQFVFCALMGFFIAFMVTLRPIVIVYLVGLKKLTNGFGLNMMTMGFSGLMGVPIATAVFEATNTYSFTFLLTGCFFLLSGALMIFSLHVHRWNQPKN